MNTNIRAMKRMRQTHAKFAALNHPEDGESPEDASDVLGIGVDVDDSIDESPWKVPEQGSGIEIGEERAGDCLNWMGGKVLEHSGFQGVLYYGFRFLKEGFNASCWGRDLENSLRSVGRGDFGVFIERWQNFTVFM